jgi:pyrroline-5-carboxylate reductase
MLNETLAFIGGGNMARSLIGGLLAKGLPASQIVVADPIESQRVQLAEQYGVQVTADNNQAARAAQIIVLAVKPQELATVARGLAATVSTATPQPLVISIAAGIRATDLQAWLDGVAVVRTMPNRPALNGCGITGLYASAAVSAAQRELATRILSAVGKAIWVDQETHIDAVTAVSGSGPAYFFLLMELLEAAGVELGLTAEVSRALAIETAYGAAYMARELDDSPAVLRQQVTSKGGTTEAALKVFATHDLAGIVSSAAKAAATRSAELATQLAGG